MPAEFDEEGNIIINKQKHKFDELGRPINKVYTWQHVDLLEEKIKRRNKRPFLSLDI